jgi:hypothetical protein
MRTLADSNGHGLRLPLAKDGLAVENASVNELAQARHLYGR